MTILFRCVVRQLMNNLWGEKNMLWRIINTNKHLLVWRLNPSNVRTERLKINKTNFSSGRKVFFFHWCCCSFFKQIMHKRNEKDLCREKTRHAATNKKLIICNSNRFSLSRNTWVHSEEYYDGMMFAKTKRIANCAK